MDWSERLNGGLAKTEHGFFSYERGAARYGEGNGMPLTLHGFLTLDAAKATAEKYAKSLDVSEVVQSRKFGQVGNLQPWLASSQADGSRSFPALYGSFDHPSNSAH